MAGGLEAARARQNEALKMGVLGGLQNRYNYRDVRGINPIMDQFFGRLDQAFGGLVNVRGKRILDMPCGSTTSRESSGIRSLVGDVVLIPSPSGYSRLFEPWFCRIVSALGGEAVGIDMGELDTRGEDFTYHKANLGEIGALSFLPDASFDGIQDSRLFGSPEFREQFPDREDRRRIAIEIRDQELRLLKPGGVVIHTDTTKTILNP